MKCTVKQRFAVAIFTSCLATASVARAQAENLILHPDWLRKPSAGDLQRLYPKGVHGVTAKVVADCLVDEMGKFSACEVVEENPAGFGFGDSTIQLSKLFRMRPMDADGASVAGRRLRLPVAWYATYRP